jgi:hypothetical protein
LVLNPVNAYQFDLRYDPSVLEPAAAAATADETLSQGLSVVYNSPEPGLLKVVVYGATTATGDGVYLNLHFRVRRRVGSSAVSLSEFRIGDGRLNVTVRNGSVTVVRPSATIRD